jgi:hypothetical protein
MNIGFPLVQLQSVTPIAKRELTYEAGMASDNFAAALRLLPKNLKM